MASVTKLTDVGGFQMYDGAKLPMIDEAIAAFDGTLSTGLAATMLETARGMFDKLGLRRELDDVCVKGRSNRRPMCWTRIVIDAGAAFDLHCHPNIEVIHVVSGCLVEDRLKGPPLFKGPFLNGRAAVLDADLTTKTADDFETKRWPAGSVLVNEIGSVHLSYCSPEEGCDLFVLWGGCHASISKPPPPWATSAAA